MWKIQRERMKSETPKEKGIGKKHAKCRRVVGDDDVTGCHGDWPGATGRPGFQEKRRPAHSRAAEAEKGAV